MFTNKKPNKKAFTLIEILIVVVIVGILSTLAIVSLQNSRAKSRDAKRVTDLKQLQTALEVYYYNYKKYPENLEVLINPTTIAKSLEKIPKSPPQVDGVCDSLSNFYNYETSEDLSNYTIKSCLGFGVDSFDSGIIVASPEGLKSYNWECGYNFLDERNGKTYKTVQMGGQCWFSQNINYDNGCSLNSLTPRVDNGWCGCGNGNYCDTYGVLYQWSAAMSGSSVEGSQGICPDGWHIPSLSDVNILKNTIESNPNNYCNGLVENTSKSMASNWGWVNLADNIYINPSQYPCSIGRNQENNNSAGFNILPSGFVGDVMEGGNFYYILPHSLNSGSYNNEGEFWTSSFLNNEQFGTTGSTYGVQLFRSEFFTGNRKDINFGLPVRCLKN